MSFFTTPSGERFQIFGEGGGQELADELDVPLLGRVPLTMPLREQPDAACRSCRRPRGRGRTGDLPGGARIIAMAPIALECFPGAGGRLPRSPMQQPAGAEGAENPRACRCRWLSRRGRRCAPLPLDKTTHSRGSYMRPLWEQSETESTTKATADRPTMSRGARRGARPAGGPAGAGARPSGRGVGGQARRPRGWSRATSGGPRWSGCARKGSSPIPTSAWMERRTRIRTYLAPTTPRAGRGRASRDWLSVAGRVISWRGHPQDVVSGPARPVGDDPTRRAPADASAARPRARDGDGHRRHSRRGGRCTRPSAASSCWR